jgi:hypothetical protein
VKNDSIVIFPYKYEDMWVFDDESVGLSKEPFVCGVPEIIDLIVKKIPDADTGFKLIFSTRSFPGYQVNLVWEREQYGGNWYSWQDREGWFCPALLKYFNAAPLNIYCKAETLRKRE